MKEELDKLGLTEYQSESEDREPIDFSIADGEDNVAWVWGSEPWHDVQVECNHPDNCIDWGDDDECGECLLCGSQCTWHWEESADDGYTVKERVIDRWEEPNVIGGIIGRYLDELKGKW